VKKSGKKQSSQNAAPPHWMLSTEKKVLKKKKKNPLFSLEYIMDLKNYWGFLAKQMGAKLER